MSWLIVFTEDIMNNKEGRMSLLYESLKEQYKKLTEGEILDLDFSPDHERLSRFIKTSDNKQFHHAVDHDLIDDISQGYVIVAIGQDGSQEVIGEDEHGRWVAVRLNKDSDDIVELDGDTVMSEVDGKTVYVSECPGQVINEYRQKRPTDIRKRHQKKLRRNLKKMLKKQRSLLDDVVYGERRMDATGGEQGLTEGGAAFADVGAIHKSEIEPTLNKISKKVGVDLSDRTLGSVGKKEFSGDIDVVITPDEFEEINLFNKLKSLYGPNNVRKIGSIITARVDIEGYDESKDERQPRTGYVQVDFMVGEPDWLKTAYHAPGEESALKGTHRNQAIAAITAHLDRKESDEVDDYGRPVELIRWKWSPKSGLHKVRRRSKYSDQRGKYLKTQVDEPIGEFYTDANDIADILFDGKKDASALNSAEEIIDAVKDVYDGQVRENIFRTMAENFKSRNDWEQYEYPEEISKYMELGDG